MKNGLSERIEQFYLEVTAAVAAKELNYRYKDIDLLPTAIQFYLNEFINSFSFFKEIESIQNEAEWHRFIAKYVNGFAPKISLLKRIQLAASDVLRYVASLRAGKPQAADYYFFITNNKFLKFTADIKLELEKQTAKQAAYLIWERKDQSLVDNALYALPAMAFPAVWTRDYSRFRNYSLLVDRVLGYHLKNQTKKIILVEGCVLAEHIVALVSRKLTIPNVCIQWGFFAKTVTQAGWRNMPFDQFLVWGTFYKKAFSAYNPQLSCLPVGHPTLSFANELVKNKSILFGVQKVMGDHITEADIYRFLDFAIQFAQNHPDFEVIIRSHPDFNIPESYLNNSANPKNLVWHNYRAFTLTQSFEKAKYCVSISSTLSTESIAHGCYPLFLRASETPLQVYDLLATSNDFTHVFDFSNFDAGILHLETLDTALYLNELRQQMFTHLGKTAVSTIVENIRN
ncbi:MAG: hypothetical protein CFE24_03725 [Flavobacterium sp. BFFFF2]|nr:MAG: hypothetical protein CFE24_03725 [Flavobacterium sp. BFFFF2]